MLFKAASPHPSKNDRQGSHWKQTGTVLGKALPNHATIAAPFEVSAAGRQEITPGVDSSPGCKLSTRPHSPGTTPVNLRWPAWGRGAAGCVDTQGKAQGSRKLSVLSASGSPPCAESSCCGVPADHTCLNFRGLWKTPAALIPGRFYLG